jgi:hypothetical protein
MSSNDIYDGFGPYGPFMTKMDQQEQDKAGMGLEPGDEGYWPVWGGNARDIRPGDLLFIGWKITPDDGSPSYNKFADVEVAEMAEFTAPTMNSIRVGFITTSGVFASVGMLQPVQICRWGTHNTLANSI